MPKSIPRPVASSSAHDLPPTFFRRRFSRFPSAEPFLADWRQSTGNQENLGQIQEKDVQPEYDDPVRNSFTKLGGFKSRKKYAAR